MISYFLARSQCGRAPSASTGFFPPSRTVRLSSALRPSGTDECGILGNCTSRELSSSSCASDCWLNFLISSLMSAVFWRDASASSFRPCWSRVPICLERVFSSLCLESCNCCKDLRFLSNARMRLTISSAWKFFTLSR